MKETAVREMMHKSSKEGIKAYQQMLNNKHQKRWSDLRNYGDHINKVTKKRKLC